MPKTTTFKYVSGKSSGSNFSPTPVGTTSNSVTPSPATTTYSSTAHTERIERRHVNFNSDRTGWMDATDSQPHEAFFYVELLCNIWFIVEFTIRFLVIIYCFILEFMSFFAYTVSSVQCMLKHMYSTSQLLFNLKQIFYKWNLNKYLDILNMHLPRAPKQKHFLFHTLSVYKWESKCYIWSILSKEVIS